tara:strand:+ start:164 stop:544 length:381 start_codon:yes stop_codon:yes gene_type:complete
MATVNQYKFVGKSGDTTGSPIFPFGENAAGFTFPLINEVYIVKSILVWSTGTPKVLVNAPITNPDGTKGGTSAIYTAPLTANVSQELLTQPLVIEGGGFGLSIQASTTDQFQYGISYLNIKKEVTT